MIKIDSDGDCSSDENLTPAEMLRRDRKDILHPVLSFFDKKYLAPLNSPLWLNEVKKTMGPDGKTVLKKYPNLNLKLWQKLIRSLLKRIMGPAYLTNHSLTARFRFAAKKIITKRRANHIQNYRLKGTHKRLIYDDDSELQSNGRLHMPYKSKLKKKLTFDENNDVAACPVRKKSKIDDAEDAECSQTKKSNSAVPPVSMYTNKTKCVGCKKPLECRSAFPQDHQDWSEKVTRSMRCVEC